MKEYISELVAAASNLLQGRHIAREYLQARILAGLQQAGAMIPLAFHGGTALRFLYRIPRYSEDLDFALEQAAGQYDFHAYLRALRAVFEAEAYRLDIKLNDKKVVHSAFIRFPGLLHELNLSPHQDEALSIKIEVDTRPPSGAVLQTSLIRNYVLLHLQHHDPASLLAGKLHAILQRPYAKGRDLYDLFWYLSDPDWPPPNLLLLNNALAQTGWQGAPITPENWRQVIWERVNRLDWDTAIAELQAFLINLPDQALLTKETLRRLLLNQ